MGLTVIIRLLLPRLFGLLDGDSVSLFIDAEKQMRTGVPSITSTLQVFLISLAYRIGGTKLTVARYVPLLAGWGTMLLLYLQGDDPKERTGVWAALLYGVLPISIFFGVSELPYGTMAFLAVLALWSLVQAQGKGLAWLGIVAGLALGGAFLCKTFAAVFILPVGYSLVFHLRNERERREKRWTPDLLALAVWAAIVGGAIIWRLPVFGWSIFNDYPTDWRFDLATQIWSARWFDLINLHSLALPILAPGVALAIARRNAEPFVRLGIWLIAADVAVYLFNPVNHFPRVLLPATPFLAYIAAAEMTRAVEGKRFQVLVAWALTAFLLLVVRLSWPDWWLNAQPWTLVAETLAGLAVFAFLAVLWPRQVEIDGESAVAFLLTATTLFGFVAAYRDLDRVERLSMARIETVRFADVTSGLLGGGDVVYFLMRDLPNVSILTDLPRERLLQMLREGLPATMRAMGMTTAIEDRADTDGILAMVKNLATEEGIALPPDYSPFARLAADPLTERLFDNGLFALYRLTDVPPATTAAWPEWSRVEPELDRAGLGLIHPLPARLVVTQRPGPRTPGGAVDRLITAELTVWPDRRRLFEIHVRALNQANEAIWEQQEIVAFPAAPDSPGVHCRIIAVDREPPAGQETVIVPKSVRDVAAVEIGVQPEEGGPPLIALVRTPSWW